MSHKNNIKYAYNVNEGRQFLRLVLGIFALSLGTLVYLIDRPANKTYLISDSISLFDRIAPLFGTIGNHLPTFSHVFAFILITAALTSARRSSYLFICGIWLLIDFLFELGQHGAISSHIASNLPPYIVELPILSHAVNYFQNGRYDPIDLASIFLGTVAAYGVLLLTEKTASPIS